MMELAGAGTRVQVWPKAHEPGHTGVLIWVEKVDGCTVRVHYHSTRSRQSALCRLRALLCTGRRRDCDAAFLDPYTVPGTTRRGVATLRATLNFMLEGMVGQNSVSTFSDDSRLIDIERKQPLPIHFYES